MAPIVVETPIRRRPDEVFAYLRDHSNQLVWQAKHVIEVRVEPEGPSNVGTQIHKVRRTPAGKLSFTEEVTELEASQRRWVEVTRTGGLTGSVLTWQVLDDDEGARVRLSAELKGTGINRLLLPLVIRRSATRDWRDEQASLKRILEA